MEDARRRSRAARRGRGRVRALAGRPRGRSGSRVPRPRRRRASIVVNGSSERAAAVQVRGHALDGGLWMPGSELERGDADRQVGGIPVGLELGEHRPCALGLSEHEPELGLHQSAPRRARSRGWAAGPPRTLRAGPRAPGATRRASSSSRARTSATVVGSRRSPDPSSASSARSANCSAFSSSCHQRCTTASET